VSHPGTRTITARGVWLTVLSGLLLLLAGLMYAVLPDATEMLLWLADAIRAGLQLPGDPPITGW